jgi:hypothetical protein
MANLQVARRFSLGIAGMIFGLAAVSERALAQNASETSSNRGLAPQAVDPGVRGGAPGAGGSLGATLRIGLLVMTVTLSGCATGPLPQWLDAQATCQKLAQTSAS